MLKEGGPCQINGVAFVREPGIVGRIVSDLAPVPWSILGARG